MGTLVLASDGEQLATASERGARASVRLGGPLATRIEPLKRFWPAEGYHQKYHLRNDRVLAAEFKAMFEGNDAAFVDSTSAARVNGYLAGDGTRAQLAGEIDFLGLGEAGRARLVSKVGNSAGGVGCSIL